METFARPETSTPPQPPIDLSTHLYYQLVYTLTNLLPPPIDDTPGALRTRNRAAIAKVAALLPVNANEADLAAQCIAARAQAEDLLSLLRQNADDIDLVLRLNAQYGSMVRTSLSVHARLMRIQALRQKREAIEGAANEDASALQIAERSMLGVLNPAAGPHQAAWPTAARATLPAAARATLLARATSPTGAPAALAAAAPVSFARAAPKAFADMSIEELAFEIETNSHDTALETWLNEQPWYQGARDSGETGRRGVVRESPPNGRESPVRAG
jgi:hypothetical protein